MVIRKKTEDMVWRFIDVTCQSTYDVGLSLDVQHALFTHSNAIAERTTIEVAHVRHMWDHSDRGGAMNKMGRRVRKKVENSVARLRIRSAHAAPVALNYADAPELDTCFDILVLTYGAGCQPPTFLRPLAPRTASLFDCREDD